MSPKCAIRQPECRDANECEKPREYLVNEYANLGPIVDRLGWRVAQAGIRKVQICDVAERTEHAEQQQAAEREANSRDEWVTHATARRLGFRWRIRVGQWLLWVAQRKVFTTPLLSEAKSDRNTKQFTKKKSRCQIGGVRGVANLNATTERTNLQTKRCSKDEAAALRKNHVVRP